MRGSRIFFIVIAVMAVLLFIVQMQMPKPFDWTPTFGHRDSNPFGCLVFDSVMAQTMPHGYRVERKTLYQMSKERGKQAVLLVSDQLDLNRTDIREIKKLLAEGSKVMLVACRRYGEDTDSLLFKNFGIDVKSNGNYFDFTALRKQFVGKEVALYAPVYWRGTSAPYPQAVYSVYAQLLSDKLIADSAVAIDSLSSGRLRQDLLAAKRKVGHGELILVSHPLLFTNFGLLNGHAENYIMRLMNEVADRPVVRLDTSPLALQTGRNETSPFRHFLQQPPLRWALYLSLITVLLMMGFTARRRQRVIPVVKTPDNKSLEFVQLIGTLYYQQHDNTDLVRKKFIYFAETLRERLMVDVEDTADNNRTVSVLSQKTGIAREEIDVIIKDLRLAYHYEANISQQEMQQYIDKMNKIINEI